MLFNTNEMSKNINKAITQQLFSTNTKEVLSAIKQLGEKGNKEYLPILFEILTTNTDKQVSESICKLLGNIKDKETIPVFISALKEEKYQNARKSIISACWLNSLDFSEHTEDFVDLVIAEDWETAFEAFTVIENIKNFPSGEKGKDIKLKIAAAIKNNNEQKTYLLEEILKLSSQ